jgi:hypothetical protein
VSFIYKSTPKVWRYCLSHHARHDRWPLLLPIVAEYPVCHVPARIMYVITERSLFPVSGITRIHALITSNRDILCAAPFPSLTIFPQNLPVKPDLDPPLAAFVSTEPDKK